MEKGMKIKNSVSFPQTYGKTLRKFMAEWRGGGVSYMGNNDQIMQGKVLQMHFPVIWTV